MAELSGPSAAALPASSTPSTLIGVGKCPTEPAAAAATAAAEAAEPAAGTWLGMVKVSLVSFSVSPPAAAATPFSLATDATSLAGRCRAPVLVRLSMLTFVPASGRCPLLPPRGTGTQPGPKLPTDGALVTVISVSCPYSECSTSPCAFFTPPDRAVTVITRPMPSARPSAMMLACRHAGAAPAAGR